MDNQRLLRCLAADNARLGAVAAGDLTARVPSCPEWTVTDLVRHVAMVYQHKAEIMRRNAFPRPWPPETPDEPPLVLLDRAYASLVGEFAARDPATTVPTWFEPDQTVGFWIRRMAQETVIHRVDAELALKEPIAAVPADLAEDGVDEVLERCLAYGSRAWPEDFEDHLAGCDGRTVRIATGEHQWLVRLAPEGVEVTTAGRGEREAAASVTGDPRSVLLWLWRRAGDDAVQTGGDRALVAKLHELLGVATQ
ncbi:MAG TPA: maleylpyruvate isomerase family mycothiol-dependent enzyme [Micromonosporaceae bacterium]|jgi:uncharacterized protein (TIGR03083 family)